MKDHKPFGESIAKDLEDAKAEGRGGGKPPKTGIWTLLDARWPRACEVQLDADDWVAMCTVGGALNRAADGALACRTCGVRIEPRVVTFGGGASDVTIGLTGHQVTAL